MSKILSDEAYKRIGEEIDEKLAPMQKIIFDQAMRKQTRDKLKRMKKIILGTKKKTKDERYFIYYFDCKAEKNHPVIEEDGYEDQNDHVNFKSIKKAKSYIDKLNREMSHTFFVYFFLREKSKKCQSNL